MENFKKVLLDEIPEFKDYTLNFLNGNISKMQYKGFSGGYGVYAQRDQKSFMIRLRTSCGVLCRNQLHTIYQMANGRNLSHIHLTTRQAIQLHGLDVDGIVDIMREGIEKDIFTRGGGGNFPRNVGLSPLSGVDKDEAFDVTPYALATDKYFMSHITTYHLPRKLKVSYSSSNKDCAHATVQDLGFVATIVNNEPYFDVYVGGGLGKDPKVGLKLNHPIKPSEALYYVEGLVKLFIDEGNYENKNKARVRYMVDKLGEEEFLSKFEQYAKKEMANKNLELNPTPINYSKSGVPIYSENPRLIEQKQDGLYSVYIHPIGGLYPLKNFKSLLYELDKVKEPMIRLAMTEGLYILNLDGNEAKKILETTEDISGNSSLEKSVSCIGVPICQMGIQNSQKMLIEIINYFRANSNDKKVLNIMPRIYISGCMNSCAVHQIGAIGLTGKMKKVDGVSTDAFGMTIDGNFHVGESRLGNNVGDFAATNIPKMLYEIGESLVKQDEDFYSWIKNNKDEFESIINKYKI